MYPMTLRDNPPPVLTFCFVLFVAYVFACLLVCLCVCLLKIIQVETHKSKEYNGILAAKAILRTPGKEMWILYQVNL